MRSRSEREDVVWEVRNVHLFEQKNDPLSHWVCFPPEEKNVSFNKKEKRGKELSSRLQQNQG